MEQLHAFLRYRLGGRYGGYSGIGLDSTFKNMLYAAKDEITASHSELKELMLKHEGTCNAERAELFRTVNRYRKESTVM